MSSRAENGSVESDLSPIPPDTDTEAPAETSEATEQILAFLATAPEAVAPWANAQAERIRRNGLGPADGLDPADESLADDGSLAADADSDAEVDAADPDADPHAAPVDDETAREDLLAAELGEEDDDIVKDRAPKARRKGRVANVETNPAYLKKRTSSAGKLLLAGVFALAVAFAVYFAGKPAPEPATAPHPTMGTTQQEPSAAERAARVAELQNIIEKDPTDTKARLELGVLQFNQRETSKAEEQWTTVIEQDPKEVQAWYNLGFLYLSKEPAETDKAREAWQKVVDLAPDSDLARTADMHLKGLSDGSH